MPYRDNSDWARKERAFLRQPFSPATIASYRRVLHRVRAQLKVDSPSRVTLDMLHKFEWSLKGKQNARAFLIAVLRSFLKWCGSKSIARWKPIVRRNAKENRVWLSETQVEAARRAAEGVGIESELIYSLMVDNGFRIVDCYRLTLGRAKALLLQPRAMILSKGRYGGKERPVSLHRRTRSLMEQYLAWRSSLPGIDTALEWLFVARNGRRRKWHRMTKATIATRIEDISEAVGFYVRSHDLRATFGHRHYINGTPLPTIAHMMGHESPTVTFQAYIGVTADLAQTAQDRLA